MCCKKVELDMKHCSFVKSLKKDINKHPENYYKHWKFKIVENEENPMDSLWKITLNEGLISTSYLYIFFNKCRNPGSKGPLYENKWQAFLGDKPEAIDPLINMRLESHDHFVITKLANEVVRFEFTTKNGSIYCLEAGTKQQLVDARPKDEHKLDQQWKITV